MRQKQTALVMLFVLICAKAYTQKDLPEPYQSLNQSAFPKTKQNARFIAGLVTTGWALQNYFTVGRMSLRMKNATIEQVLEELKQKDNSYIFWINREIRSIKLRADINIINATMPDALYAIAEKFPIDYLIREDFIKIYLKRSLTPKELAAQRNGGNSFINATLLDSVEVKFNNGYQKVPKKDATDNYLQPDDKKFKTLTTAPNIISRLQIIGWPLLIDNKNSMTGPVSTSLRGPNSFRGNQFATNVVDGFRITNTDFFNPFDIDVLRTAHIKTAAAGALWGTTSANGVNVFETQSGLTSGRELNLFSSFSIGERKNINYWKTLDAATRIEAEKLAFHNSALSMLSPVGNVLSQGASQGQGWVDSVLSSWSKNNLSKQIQEELYQNEVFHQVALNFRSGSGGFKNYLSGGIDYNKMAEKGNTWSRQTLFGKSSYQDSLFFIQLSGAYTNILARNNFIFYPNSLSYLNLFDEFGNPKPVPYRYSPDFIANAGQQGFLDLKFSPINEARISDDLERQQYYSLAGKISYTILKGFQASLSFQLAHTNYDHKINHSLESFYSRDLINQYRTTDGQGSINWNIPIADIFDRMQINGTIINWRGQLDYVHKWGAFGFTGIIGAEKSKNDMELSSLRIYGKNISFPQTKIDYDKKFPLSLNSGFERIPFYNYQKDSADHFFSYYANVYFTFKDKYIFSFIARTDLSNRFDSSLNKFGVGFMSGGGAWYISKENFFPLPKRNDLKIRLSFGVNGNIDYTMTKSSTIQSIDYQGSVYSVVLSQTPKLAWEKIYIGNAGIDFQLAKGLITGSVDYFRKWGKDLLNITDWNPTTGYNSIRNNSGTLTGKGIDVTLDTKEFYVAPHVKMGMTFLFSHSTNKVTSRAASSIAIPAWQLVNPGTSSPRTGYPINAVFVFKSAGLNHTNGSPIGYLAKDTSEDYDKLVSATDGSSIEYVGSAIPTSLASLVPSVRYKSFTLTAVVAGKFGYYTWIKPVDYKGIFQELGVATPDYLKRWQKSGDESTTDIQSLQFPINDNREFFSKFRGANVIRADNIRLQTIQLAYSFDKKNFSKLPFKKLELFFSVNNLGIIYRANKRGIDPDVSIDSYPSRRSITISLLATY